MNQPSREAMAGKLQIYADGWGKPGLALVAYLRDLCVLL
jgi:hypothetical protein